MLFRLDNQFLFDSINMLIFKDDNNIFDMNNQHLKCENKKILKKEKIDLKNKFVDAAGVIPTFNCNLRCKYCSQSSTEGKKDLDFNNFKAFINEIIRKKIIESILNSSMPILRIYFTGGGEPTYNWELFKLCVEYIVSSSKRYGLSYDLHVTTNGCFDHKKSIFISNYFSNVMISYDGTDSINLKNRLNGNKVNNLEIIKNNIFFLSKKTNVTLRSTVFPFDFKNMNSIYENIVMLFPKVKYIDFNPVLPVGRALKYDYDYENNIKTFLYSYLNLTNNHKLTVPVTTPILSSEPVELGCGGVSSIASEYWLFPDNIIRTCSDSYDNSVDIAKVENGKFIYFDLFGDIFEDNINSNIKRCQKCIALPVCGYGCPLKRIRDAKNSTNYSLSECSLEQYYWMYVLKNTLKYGKYKNWILEPIKSGQKSVFKVLFIKEK